MSFLSSSVWLMHKSLPGDLNVKVFFTYADVCDSAPASVWDTYWLLKMAVSIVQLKGAVYLMENAQQRI